MTVPAPLPPLAATPEPVSDVTAHQGGAPAWGPWVGAGVALLPALLAVAQLGRIHPDEVYQLLEPAWFRTHGYGVLAWEWRVGLRNWAAPLVASGLLRLASLLGLTHPVAYRALLAVPQVALHGWMLWAAYRFAERRVGPRGGLLAMLAMGLYGPVLVFAGRTLGESLSAAFLVVAMEALDRPERSARGGLVGGAALGLAVVVRYGSAVMVLMALAWLVGARRWRTLAWTCLAGGVVAVGLGVLDQVTWGRPFHSFLAYVDFNVLSGQAARQFGASPPSYYLGPWLRGLPGWIWLVAPLAWAAWRQRPSLSLPGLCAVGYFAALLFTAHKEERFLYPGLLLLVLAAAPVAAGFVVSRGATAWRAVGGALLLLTAVVPGVFLLSEDLRGDQFRAIVSATRDEGTRGLLIVNEGLWGAGGFFYIGKNIPWMTCDWPQDANFQRAMRDARFNRAVTFDGRALAELQAAGFQVMGRVGRETLLTRP
ncbi:glycosyltransferase family 39 protein [Cystobacter fuscus]|uniref:glycosyltransferase family 39 protein n=1 Tax=Cystobacter fuscus TaxID=43 RepID=UPI0005BE4D64|nr:glycosyltransferase family 39 protein [Cystobacter fuscus]